MTSTEASPKMDDYYETSYQQYLEYRQDYCYICDHYTYTEYMEERDGVFYCDRCAKLPSYSDELYNGLVAFQRLFRAHFAAKAKPCGSCKKPCLKTHDYYTDKAPICGRCLDDALYEERQALECPGCGYENCHCDDGSGYCSECEGTWGCICAEQKEDAHLIRHRRICGMPACEGDCGTLDCGCIDVCRRGHDEW